MTTPEISKTVDSYTVNVVGAGAMIANSKTFSTGSKGYFASQKLVIGGKSYQCQVQMILIGSKPK